MASYFVKSGVLSKLDTIRGNSTLEIDGVSFRWRGEERWDGRKLDLQVGDVIEIAGKVFNEDTRSPVYEAKALYVANTNKTYGIPDGVGGFIAFLFTAVFAAVTAVLTALIVPAPVTAPMFFELLKGLRDFFVTRKCGRMLPHNVGDTEQLAPAE